MSKKAAKSYGRRIAHSRRHVSKNLNIPVRATTGLFGLGFMEYITL